MPRGRPVISRPAVLDLSPGPLQDAVLRRVTCAVALQSRLRPEEMDGLDLVARAVALGVAGCGGRLRVELHPGDGTVAVRLGPLGTGRGRAVIAATDARPGTSPRLAHPARVERVGAEEFVHLLLGRPAA